MAGPIDFSVLTPAVEGKFVVASAFDLTSLVPPFLAIGTLGNSQRSTKLRTLVARERYDPVKTIADRLIEALGEASYRAVYEPIARKSAGSLQSLSWGDLPERPQGELMLDLTIRWICLCSDIAFSKSYPAISVNWRLLNPAQEITQPTRTLTYFHYPAFYKDEKSPLASKAREQLPPEYPVEVVSESCGFDSIKDAEQNPAVLWGCFGEAYDAALRRLVIDLRKVHPPRPAVTVSTDTPSGKSTR